MHIGLFSPVWPPGSAANGISTYVEIVRSELLRRGHRVSVISGDCQADPAQRVYKVEEQRRSRLWRSIRRRLATVVPTMGDFGDCVARTVELVHSRDPLDVFEMEESFGWCGSVAKRAAVPLVVKLHGPAFLSLIDAESQSPERLLRIRREGRALQLARLIVSPSRATLLDTAQRYQLDTRKLVSLPNPVGVVGTEQIWQAENRRKDELLFVGRFDHRKGGDVVIQAFARLAASRPDLHLNFVGPDTGLSLEPGSLQGIAEYLETRVPPEIAARVHFLGRRPIDEIQRLRAACAVTLIATRWESFGYAVAEAMMQACPVVAFDVAGVNELIVDGENGLLAPLDDVPAFADRVGRLLDQPELASRLGSKARETVIQQCGVQIVVDRMLDMYRKVMVSDLQRPSRGRLST